MERWVDLAFHSQYTAKPGGISTYHKLMRPNDDAYPKSPNKIEGDINRNAFVQVVTLLFFLWQFDVIDGGTYKFEDDRFVNIYR